MLARVLGARADHRGQSLVEFALVLPILLLLTLIAVDFGRVYLGWINLQNMARIGANYAANNSDSLQSQDATTVANALATYAKQMSSDASATNCPLAPGQPAAPTFSDADNNGKTTDIGDHAVVTLVCRFHVITPLISFIVGSNLDVTVSSVFPIKSTIVEGPVGGGGGGGGCLTPSAGINATPTTTGSSPLTVTFRDASGGGAPTGWHWVFTVPTGATAIPDSMVQDPGAITFTTAGTYTVVLTASNACGSTTSAPTTITVTPNNPPPTCTVPNFTSNGGVAINSAQGVWNAANFTTTVQIGNHPNSPANWKIKSQTIVAGTQVACDSTITVSNP